MIEGDESKRKCNAQTQTQCALAKEGEPTGNPGMFLRTGGHVTKFTA